MKVNDRRIRSYMAKRSFSVRELAEAYGCSRQRMQMIIHSTNLQSKTVGKLANALGVDVLDIIETDEC